MSRLIGLLLVLAGLGYPFAVYYGMEHLSPRLFALLLGGLWLARSLSAAQRPGNRWTAVAALGFCLLLGLVNQAELLRWYPVLMSAALLGLFGASLFHGTPLVERLARLREPELPEVAVRYTRRVTAVWAGFFLANGLVAAGLTLWAPLSWWTLYTGFIAYLLMGLLFAGEWLVRQRVRRFA
ncbi:membrane protein [Pseudomonas sp. No.21]|jgi:uncharacterized membrane protein|uniref:COG4648 family protein n=1 Tax=Pseudomonas TaxID=286 RepID=UPI000DAA86F0|nr:MULTISPECIES: hypothetical protein [Pseudomonas]MDW3712595.1 hypothetical protein [Pseudomonas sp. 2023EL-01195]PZE14744.1 hypothetical protein DMX10_03520 [Pseudomonas sp. 57B-090624]GJN44288.1 membrane protein [Pseudomonas tohonis]